MGDHSGSPTSDEVNQHAPQHPDTTTTNNHNEDGHEVLRITGGGGDDALYLDSDDEFRLQLPTPGGCPINMSSIHSRGTGQ